MSNNPLFYDSNANGGLALAQSYTIVLPIAAVGVVLIGLYMVAGFQSEPKWRALFSFGDWVFYQSARYRRFVLKTPYRPSPLFVLLCVAMIISIVVLASTKYDPLAGYAFVYFSYFVALCLHEYAHAVALSLVGGNANRLWVREKGFMTLDPFFYLRDGGWLTLFSALLMTVFGFGVPGAAVSFDETPPEPAGSECVAVCGHSPAEEAEFKAQATAVRAALAEEESKKPAHLRWSASPELNTSTENNRIVAQNAEQSKYCCSSCAQCTERWGNAITARPPDAVLPVFRCCGGARYYTSCVAAAGPLMNIVFAILLTLPFIMNKYSPWVYTPSRGVNTNNPYAWDDTIWNSSDYVDGEVPYTDLYFALAIAGFYQWFIVVYNVLPIPGHDGFLLYTPCFPRCTRFFTFTPKGIMIGWGIRTVAVLILWFAPEQMFQVYLAIAGGSGITIRHLIGGIELYSFVGPFVGAFAVLAVVGWMAYRYASKRVPNRDGSTPRTPEPDTSNSTGRKYFAVGTILLLFGFVLCLSVGYSIAGSRSTGEHQPMTQAACRAEFASDFAAPGRSLMECTACESQWVTGSNQCSEPLWTDLTRTPANFDCPSGYACYCVYQVSAGIGQVCLSPAKTFPAVTATQKAGMRMATVGWVFGMGLVISAFAMIMYWRHVRREEMAARLGGIEPDQTVAAIETVVVQPPPPAPTIATTSRT